MVAGGRAFTRLVFTDSVKRVQAHHGTRERCARLETSGPEQRALNEQAIDLLSRTRSLSIATVNAEGWPYVQHRGGPSGFVKVVSPTELLLPDYDGNGQFVTVGNLLENPRLQLLVIDTATRERLKVWGRGTVTASPDTLKVVDDVNYSHRPRRVIRIDVQGWDFNCHRHLVGR